MIYFSRVGKINSLSRFSFKLRKFYNGLYNLIVQKFGKTNFNIALEIKLLHFGLVGSSAYIGSLSQKPVFLFLFLKNNNSQYFIVNFSKESI